MSFSNRGGSRANAGREPGSLGKPKPVDKSQRTFTNGFSLSVPEKQQQSETTDNSTSTNNDSFQPENLPGNFSMLCLLFLNRS
jgi:hypothetical protein